MLKLLSQVTGKNISVKFKTQLIASFVGMSFIIFWQKLPIYSVYMDKYY